MSFLFVFFKYPHFRYRSIESVPKENLYAVQSYMTVVFNYPLTTDQFFFKIESILLLESLRAGSSAIDFNQ